jgi:hypothetical protein
MDVGIFIGLKQTNSQFHFWVDAGGVSAILDCFRMRKRCDLFGAQGILRASSHSFLIDSLNFKP